MKLPQLSLRDLFWLVALVAMGCGWWVKHRQLMACSAERQKSEKLVEQISSSLCGNGGSLRWSDYNGKGWVVAMSFPEPEKHDEPDRIQDEFDSVLSSIYTNASLTDEQQLHQAKGVLTFATEHIRTYPEFFEPTEQRIKHLNVSFAVFFPDHSP